MPNPFISTPTNSDKNLSGWDSRYIYIHSSQGTFEVSNDEIFKTINVDYTKGSVNLKSDYFNCDDGNSFKITMYFSMPLEGGTLKFETGLRFSNNNEATLATKNGAFHTLPSKIDYECLSKYEVILTKFKDSTGQIFLFINGSIIYSRSGEQSGTNDDAVSFIPQYGKITVTQNLVSGLIINVSGTAKIKIRSITIEEIK